MNKSKTSLLVAENCVDVLEEAPEYLASALILLCQRDGMFENLELPIGDGGMATTMTCSSSVHEHNQQQHELVGDWRAKSNIGGIFSKCVPMN